MSVFAAFGPLFETKINRVTPDRHPVAFQGYPVQLDRIEAPALFTKRRNKKVSVSEPPSLSTHVIMLGELVVRKMARLSFPYDIDPITLIA